MRMHDSHPDFLNYTVFLDGNEIPFYWWADEETGEVEVYQLSNETIQINGKPVHKLVLNKNGEAKKEILKGKVDIVKK